MKQTFINGQSITPQLGETILEAATRLGITSRQTATLMH